jgi:hypothetical protein
MDLYVLYIYWHLAYLPIVSTWKLEVRYTSHLGSADVHIKGVVFGPFELAP